ncbi:kinase-like domain-containing protein [Cantharellus anzutake]|uniref:kinase-like domain-containing protein n=1 Tax=Cantharellus anzutake TaxID=1750568 RepID=UPI001904CF0E|nr:kinase-like domain-containing protein [Cantharellus anzutake]KAF8342142.1 kinase-like domain-containing protein [Cantharellus anzutake]
MGFPTRYGGFLKEAELWSGLDHPNILKFYGICELGTSTAMVSPWLKNSNVIHYMATINPHANRLKLLEGAAEGLLHLHTYSPPIVHGDLKCANILVNDDGSACLADFGLSKAHEEVTSLSLRDAGSQRYMAPELFEGPETTIYP